MAKGYPIKIWSGLLSDGHTQKIENALWEFIWLVNKVTKEENGIGYVLRGNPIKVEDICKDLKRTYWGVYRHLQQLKKNGYINMKKAPYGLIITVNNSKKFTNKDKRLDKNDKSGLDLQLNRLDLQDNRLDPQCKANKILKDIKDIKRNIYKEILEYWNKQEIIKHKKLDDATKGKINAKIAEGYSQKDIKDAIRTYAVILKNDEYYWSHTWTLKEFLQRGFEKFKDRKIAAENYLRKDKDDMYDNRNTR